MKTSDLFFRANVEGFVRHGGATAVLVFGPHGEGMAARELRSAGGRLSPEFSLARSSGRTAQLPFVEI